MRHKKILSVLLAVLMLSSTFYTILPYAGGASITSFADSSTKTLWKFTKITSYAQLKAYGMQNKKESDMNNTALLICCAPYQKKWTDVPEKDWYDNLRCFYGGDVYDGDEVYTAKVRDLYKDFDMNDKVFYSDTAANLPAYSYCIEASYYTSSDKPRIFYGYSFNMKVRQFGIPTKKVGADPNSSWCLWDYTGFEIDDFYFGWIFGFQDNTNIEKEKYFGDTEACKIVWDQCGNYWGTSLNDVHISSSWGYIPGRKTITAYDRKEFWDSDNYSNFYIWVGEKIPVSEMKGEATILSGNALTTEKNTVIDANDTLTIEPGAVLDVTQPLFVSGKIYNYGTINIRDGGSIILKWGNKNGQILNYGNSEYTTFTKVKRKSEGNMFISEKGVVCVDSGSIFNSGTMIYNRGLLSTTCTAADATAEYRTVERLGLIYYVDVKPNVDFKNQADYYGYDTSKITKLSHVGIYYIFTHEGFFDALSRGNIESTTIENAKYPDAIALFEIWGSNNAQQ